MRHPQKSLQSGTDAKVTSSQQMPNLTGKSPNRQSHKAPILEVHQTTSEKKWPEKVLGQFQYVTTDHERVLIKIY